MASTQESRRVQSRIIRPLAAGVYGLHTIPGEDEWTFIFSNNSTSWGSFFYDPAEDALRVTAAPEDAPFAEVL